MSPSKHYELLLGLGDAMARFQLQKASNSSIVGEAGLIGEDAWNLMRQSSGRAMRQECFHHDGLLSSSAIRIIEACSIMHHTHKEMIATVHRSREFLERASAQRLQEAALQRLQEDLSKKMFADATVESDLSLSDDSEDLDAEEFLEQMCRETDDRQAQAEAKVEASEKRRQRY